MAAQQPQNATRPERGKEGITRITVGGFKSIVEEQSIEVRPLTILAGANSSGKSSIMQPLLLLKQTLEAPYDPGALLLNGPNVKFTLVDQLLSRGSDGKVSDTFHARLGVGTDVAVKTTFGKGKNKGFEVEETIYKGSKEEHRLYIDMQQEDFQAAFFAATKETFASTPLANMVKTGQNWIGKVEQRRGFLELDIHRVYETPEPTELTDEDDFIMWYVTNMPGEEIVKNYIRQIIHLPGLRGNPERTYRVTAVGAEFPGTFENYVASVIGQWQSEGNTNVLEKVARDLLRLGLTKRVAARAIDDTQIELLVSRFPYHSKNAEDDMVSIADVGLGVSQALPVVVALHAAKQRQLVYLEQPEIHLHPRAQTAMAEVLADAVLEGKQVVVETHSSLLLLGIQTLVAEGKLPPEMVKLHWFTQQEDGSTKIDSADLDEAGTFGDWPEDFAKVAMDSESRYIDASYEHLKGN